MGLFGKSFEEKVTEALREIEGLGLGAESLSAGIDGKVVTLAGIVPDMETKTRVMNEFNARVEADNVLNTIRVEAAPAQAAAPAAAPVEAAEVEWYEVKAGDTLGRIAQHFYGKASLYPKIFEANRDVLSNPDLIKVGQRLRIPK